MPVDEFGREIPGASAAAHSRASPSPQPSPLHHALTHRRDDRHHHHDDFHHHRRRPRRDERRSRRSRSSTPPSAHRRQHPSMTYQREPMLCEYLWKDTEKQQSQENADEKEENKDDQQQETYDDYRRNYCLNYVRAFFNQHLDDSWFRQTYSPLERKRQVELERSRASEEARDILEAWKESAEKFISQARLADGVKVDSSGSSRKRHRDEENTTTNPIPTSHVSPILDRILAVHEVPPQVSDDQLRRSLTSASSISNMKLYSSTPDPTRTRKTLYRSVYVVLESPAKREELLSRLHPTHDQDADAADAGGHVPRRKEELPHELELQVDHTDPYNRFEIDGDGKGGQPEAGVLPPQVAQTTVIISTRPLKRPRVVVLSAALSSAERIARDKEAAVMLARALDVSHHIPEECRLDSLLESSSTDNDADCLDVAIAYLRRVHLFSFYNGCKLAKAFGDVLNGQHGSATIHLRLKNADELLQGDGEADQDTGPDLLVQRLDDNIARALEESNEWVAKASHVVDETRDAQAAEIEELEENAKKDWIKNHAIVDDDGKARCSFHFCRKLFKDDRFLKKHLLKKHGEFLNAEMAKCHDSFMMQAWDEEERRPVPPILVDCGTTFGRVPSAVEGAEPLAADPEPELWSREEERRAAAEAAAAEREREKANFQRYEDRGRPRDDDMPPPDDGAFEEPAARGGRGFVDPDDMKDEKVELSFEDVEVVAPPPKKKRKKKKLL